jgi:hypothetical protein
LFQIPTLRFFFKKSSGDRLLVYPSSFVISIDLPRSNPTYPKHNMSRKIDFKEAPRSNYLSSANQEREEILLAAAHARQSIVDANSVNLAIDKFAPQTTDTVVESELKRQTIGLVKLEDFQRIRDLLNEEAEKKKEVERERKEVESREREKKRGERKRKQKVKLSFDDEEEGPAGMCDCAIYLSMHCL